MFWTCSNTHQEQNEPKWPCCWWVYVKLAWRWGNLFGRFFVCCLLGNNASTVWNPVYFPFKRCHICKEHLWPSQCRIERSPVATTHVQGGGGKHHPLSTTALPPPPFSTLQWSARPADGAGLTSTAALADSVDDCSGCCDHVWFFYTQMRFLMGTRNCCSCPLHNIYTMSKLFHTSTVLHFTSFNGVT